MPFPLSVQTIDALAEIISGGNGNDFDRFPIGRYRTGPQIEKFMRGCNVDFRVEGSRLPSLVDCLMGLNEGPDAARVLAKVVEKAADRRDFLDEPGRHITVVDYLNRRLDFDGFEIEILDQGVRLVATSASAPVVSQFSQTAGLIDFDTVTRDIDRALANIESDPEDAVTAACSIIESVCRSILFELGEPLPAKKDVQGLFDAVKRPLGLSPDGSYFDKRVAEDIRTTLGGLASVAKGIGALRTHGGDAHGRERGHRRIDARISRLAVHAASTLGLFLIETWQLKFPNRDLRRHWEAG